MVCLHSTRVPVSLVYLTAGDNLISYTIFGGCTLNCKYDVVYVCSRNENIEPREERIWKSNLSENRTVSNLADHDMILFAPAKNEVEKKQNITQWNVLDHLLKYNVLNCVCFVFVFFFSQFLISISRTNLEVWDRKTNILNITLFVWWKHAPAIRYMRGNPIEKNENKQTEHNPQYIYVYVYIISTYIIQFAQSLEAKDSVIIQRSSCIVTGH